MVAQPQFQLNDPKITNAWAFYDWANSVYPLVITSTIFPEYYNRVTSTQETDLVHFLGFEVVNTALYSYALAFSFLLISVLSPFLSGIADYTGRKKTFMRFFAWLGAFACAMLFNFTGPNLLFGIAFFTLASIGFAGSLVFYNAYLPEIATSDRHDRLSARGFSMGYIGSILLLGFNLWMILQPDFFGLSGNTTLSSRISFLTVGIWWFGFSLVTFYWLPANVFRKQPKGSPYLQGFHELKSVWRALRFHPLLKRFLGCFFVYSVGLQTVMYMAPTFGAKEIGLPGNKLIISIMVIQVIAIVGATLFARLSGKIGNIPTLITMVIIWIGVCGGAYFVYDATGFYILAFMVGLVMGGIQSLSRSTYSKLLPETEGHASFFSFFDVTEKIAIVLGLVVYGAIEDITGSMRNSIVFLIAFFVIGLVLLINLNQKQMQMLRETQ